MNQKLWSGITTTALATVLGTTSVLIGSLNQTIASNSNQEDNPVATQSSLTPTVSPSQIDKISTSSTSNPIATIYPHGWQGKLAVTLRVRDIPILTFLEEQKIEKNNRDNSPINQEITEESLAETNSFKKAKNLADRLNQLYQEKLDATQINVTWNAQSKAYEIYIKDEVLVSIDRATILPDTTNKKDVDALQATNRLRRLMGDAPPLSEIDWGRELVPDGTTTTNSSSTSRATATPYKKGIASWYGPGFHGRRTANGERYNQNGLTAAHRYLPFGTKVRVTNLNNGRSVTVRINDRGPFIGGRIIDLSKGAASAIGMFGSGIAPVSLEIID